MRELTTAEKNQLEKRKLEFDTFREERMPVLHKFAKILQCPESHEILIMPEKFLPHISKYFEEQIVEDDNRSWFLTRIGYFIGELLVSKLDGCWIIDEQTESETFSHYVIGEFDDNKGKVFDPFSLAQVYVDTPPPRNLVEHLRVVTGDF